VPVQVVPCPVVPSRRSRVGVTPRRLDISRGVGVRKAIGVAARSTAAEAAYPVARSIIPASGSLCRAAS
jgi:hypothetical protein